MKIFRNKKFAYTLLILSGISSLFAFQNFTSETVSASSCSVDRAKLIPPEMQGKVYAGYQGWFRTPADGASGGWGHSGFSPLKVTSDSTDLTIDFWPDVSEYPSSALGNLQTSGPNNATGSVTALGNGSASQLFSSFKQSTTDTHLQWMKQYGIDGAFVQRFTGDLSSASSLQVLNNVKSSAEKYGRHFVVMYDITGSWSGHGCYVDGGLPDSSQGSSNPKFSIGACIEPDVSKLISLGITSSPAYLKVTIDGQQKPLIAIFGYGLNANVTGGPRGSNYIYNTSDGQAFIKWLKDKGFAVMGGTPTYWGSAGNCGGIVNGDIYLDTLCDNLPLSLQLPTWTSTFKMFDIISPWMPGRVASPTSIYQYASTTLQNDVCLVQKNGQGLLPVLFPGMSFFNTPRATKDLAYNSTGW